MKIHAVMFSLFFFYLLLPCTRVCIFCSLCFTSLVSSASFYTEDEPIFLALRMGKPAKRLKSVMNINVLFARTMGRLNNVNLSYYWARYTRMKQESMGKSIKLPM